tara:strand:+ start:1017 stop:1190 length:174 start_codon:yes stop_codon:yes gene_type:complete
MGKVKFEAELEAGETLVITATLEEGVFMHYPQEDDDYFEDDEDEPERDNVVPLDPQI